MTNREWLAAQTRTFEKLRGQRVLRWPAVEMALAESHDNGDHLWQHDSVPMLQLNLLYLVFAKETAVIATNQTEDLWGLSCEISTASELKTFEPSSILRSRELSELPIGTVSDVRIESSDRTIAAVEFIIDNARVSLRAGEVYDQNDGTLTIVYLDESILVQVDTRRPTHHSTGPARKAAQSGEFKRYASPRRL